MRIAREVGRPLVGTGDVHYLRREDYHHHTALLCVQTKSTLAAPKMTFDTNEFFLRSSEEMVEAFAEWPEAIASTLEIAERCDVEHRARPPAHPALPARGRGRARLPARARDGGAARPLRRPDRPPTRVERAEMELAVIDRMGFNAYFLIVWDFVKWAKDNGIAVGPGRGRAAGSIVAYALRITDVDPLRYDLLFERFLNPERVSMPDIDIDFSVRGRERVMQYVTDEVRARVGRADHHLRQDVPARRHARRGARARPRLRRRRPAGQAHPRSRAGPPAELRRLPAAGRAAARRPTTPTPTAKQIVDVARGLEGIVRNASIHAAAVVIAGPAADRHRAAAARRLRRRRNGTATATRVLPARHAVLDEAGRGARPAEDGLPGPAQPRRHRGRAGHHRALDRRAPGHDEPAARRRQDLRDDGPRRLGRRVPVRVRGHAEAPCARSSRPSSTTSSRSTRCTARARWTRSRRTRAASATPTRSPCPTSACAPIIGSTYGVILYQEQAMQISKTLAGFSRRQGRRPAQGDRQEEPRRRWRRSSPSSSRAAAPTASPQSVIDWLWDDQREVGRLLVQQVPRRLLRADRLPHGVAEGQLPRRVHGRADLLGHGHQGQGPVLRRPGARAWGSRSCRPT